VPHRLDRPAASCPAAVGWPRCGLVHCVVLVFGRHQARRAPRHPQVAPGSARPLDGPMRPSGFFTTCGVPTPRCFVFRTPPGYPGNPCARLLRCCPSNSLPDTRSPCIAAGRKSLTPLPGLLDRLCVRRLATCDLLISFSLDAIRIPVKPAGTECTPFLMLRQEFDASNSKTSRRASRLRRFDSLLPKPRQ